jgi:TrmH family RNA methyltransferase
MMEVITSRKNPLIQKVRRLLSSRKDRQEEGLFVSDGTKLLQEAVKWWPGLTTVILTPDVQADVPDDVEVVRVSREIMEYISPMQTPQGALFICRLPSQQQLQAKPGMLILDGIQDPGNLGTILRTADALDVPVVLLEGCADPYSHKTVRSSMGAVFRTVPVQSTWEQVYDCCRQENIPVAVTALSESARDIRQADLKQMAVVIGSEGQGVRAEILQQAAKHLIIPMTERCESLNAAVAATIVMWQMQK